MILVRANDAGVMILILLTHKHRHRSLHSINRAENNYFIIKDMLLLAYMLAEKNYTLKLCAYITDLMYIHE